MTRSDARRERRAPGTPAARGFAVFDAGELGQAHVTAHRMLDAGRPAAGRRLLEAALAGRHGRGSEWVHLQWHLLVFELALGELEPALVRFERALAPSIAEGLARTDAPSALWRLRLAGAPEARLRPHWEAVAARARADLDAPSTPWARVHDLLALGGAGDLAALDRWLTTPASDVERTELAVARLVARGLRAALVDDWSSASRRLEAACARCHDVGGSAAQRTLFASLARWATRPPAVPHGGAVAPGRAVAPTFLADALGGSDARR